MSKYLNIVGYERKYVKSLWFDEINSFAKAALLRGRGFEQVGFSVGFLVLKISLKATIRKIGFEEDFNMQKRSGHSMGHCFNTRCQAKIFTIQVWITSSQLSMLF